MSVGEMAAYAVAVLLVLLLGRLFFKPLKGVLVLMLHSLLGGLGLYIFNFVFANLGFTIGLNMATAAICGVLGLPGLLLLAFAKLLFMF